MENRDVYREEGKGWRGEEGEGRGGGGERREGIEGEIGNRGEGKVRGEI